MRTKYVMDLILIRVMIPSLGELLLPLASWQTASVEGSVMPLSTHAHGPRQKPTHSCTSLYYISPSPPPSQNAMAQLRFSPSANNIMNDSSSDKTRALSPQPTDFTVVTFSENDPDDPGNWPKSKKNWVSAGIAH